MRTIKDPDVRKQEILDGAIRIFARKGYDKTTTTDIAKELKISQGLCYRYFPTKEAIYDAALEKYADMIVQGNSRRIGFDRPVKEMIELVTGHMDQLRSAEREDEELFSLFHSEESRKMHEELFLEVAKKMLPLVQEHLRKYKEKGEISQEDTDGAAIIGVYGWIGLYLTQGLTEEERAEKARHFWYQLLGI